MKLNPMAKTEIDAAHRTQEIGGSWRVDPTPVQTEPRGTSLAAEDGKMSVNEWLQFACTKENG